MTLYVGPDTSTLYFLDPRTNPATLVQTVVTSSSPLLGWQAFTLRLGTSDLLACGGNYDGDCMFAAIDLSPYNNIADGTVTPLFSVHALSLVCDSLAWDATDSTVFFSPGGSRNIYHLNAFGALVGFASGGWRACD